MHFISLNEVIQILLSNVFIIASLSKVLTILEYTAEHCESNRNIGEEYLSIVAHDMNKTFGYSATVYLYIKYNASNFQAMLILACCTMTEKSALGYVFLSKI